MNATSTVTHARAELSAEGAPDGHGTRIYRGRSVGELIPRIQAELGEDAIVVAQRTGLAGGVGGFFQRQFIEIEAGPGRPGIDVHDGWAATPSTFAHTPDAAMERESRTAGPGVSPDEHGQAGEIFAAIDDASAAAQDISDEATFASALAMAATNPPVTRGRARAGVETTLLTAGLSEQFASALIDDAQAHALAFLPRGNLNRAVRSVLERRIPVCPPLSARGATVALVGPGGSGKSECCAALMNAYRKSGSIEASGASILHGEGRQALELLLPPRIASPIQATCARAIKALGDAGKARIAILDTPAVSPADRGTIRELAVLLRQIKPERVVVALPATLGAHPAAELLQALRPLNANALAITHADETDRIGVAIESACAFGLAPEYLLEGNRGNMKLTRTDPAMLADRLMR